MNTPASNRQKHDRYQRRERLPKNPGHSLPRRPIHGGRHPFPNRRTGEYLRQSYQRTVRSHAGDRIFVRRQNSDQPAFLHGLPHHRGSSTVRDSAENPRHRSKEPFAKLKYVKTGTPASVEDKKEREGRDAMTRYLKIRTAKTARNLRVYVLVFRKDRCVRKARCQTTVHDTKP